jgi:hypothetical protein
VSKEAGLQMSDIEHELSVHRQRYGLFSRTLAEMETSASKK